MDSIRAVIDELYEVVSELKKESNILKNENTERRNALVRKCRKLTKALLVIIE